MYYIFDNGKIINRYTFINKNGNVFTFNNEPFSFNQYSHSWKGEKQFIKEAIRNPEWIGKRVKLSDLSAEAQHFISDRR